MKHRRHGPIKVPHRER